MRPGDLVVGVLVGAQETKVRPAVVIASLIYLAERPDAVVGFSRRSCRERQARLITFSRTGDPPDSARSLASAPTS